MHRYSYNSQNSDDDAPAPSLTLEMNDNDYLRLDEKDVYDHYSCLSSCRIQNSFLVRLINFLYLLSMIFILLIILTLSALFLEIGTTYLYYIFAGDDNEIYSSALFAIICYLISLTLATLMIFLIYWWRKSFGIRILFMRHAKRLIHFGPGFKGMHESINLV